MKPYYLMAIATMGLSTVALPSEASCVQADIAVQYNISGSKQPTQRDNDVQMQSQGNCRGNASITTGVQGNEGGTRSIRQSRKVRHRYNGGNNPNSNTVQIISNPTIDVYNAADDL